MNSEIIFEDRDILVCHKRAGFPVQSKGVGAMDMESELRAYLKRTASDPYLGIVHRLDQPVEGILVFAKNRAAAAVLSKAAHKENDNEAAMNKLYEAVIFGHMKEAEGTLTNRIIFDKAKNISYIGEGRDSKEAILKYRVLKKEEAIETLLISLYTGRHHQIRLQMSANATPLLGDMKYGSEASLVYSRANNIRNVALKAVSLEFVHPTSHKPMRFGLDGYKDDYVI